MVLDQFHWILILSIVNWTVTLPETELDLRRQFIKNKINRHFLKENYGKNLPEGLNLHNMNN